MAAKTLSIAVAAYNVEDCLADSLASYCAGAIDERLEVIVVNDGSSDSTLLIAREFQKLHPGIFRVVDKENGGHGSAVNAGIACATGKYFRIIDGDDRICTVNIPALLDELDESDADIVIDLKRDVFIDTGASRLSSMPDDIPKGCTVPFDSVCMHPALETFFMIHTASVRTDLLREDRIELLEHTFYVDIEYIVKAAAQAKTIRFIDLEVCNYYLGNASQSVAPANYVRRWGDHTRVTEEMLAFATYADLDERKRAFVTSRVRLLVNTHYNIALIYDTDRKRGLERARQFRAYLKQHYPEFTRLTDKRFHQGIVLHYLGIDSGKLDRLMNR